MWFRFYFGGLGGFWLEWPIGLQTLCPQLEYFIIFSSVYCRGNAGQWGAIEEVGVVADMQKIHKLDMEIDDI